MHYGFKNRERVGRWFECGIFLAGMVLVLYDLLGSANGTIFLGLLILFVWTFILGQRNGMLLQEAERKYLKSLRQERELRVQLSYILRLTLLASLPIYLGFAFPILLLPVGGMYALAFFFPVIGVSLMRLFNFYNRWKALEVKPNFYWAMQIGICLVMVAISFAIFYLGMGGEARR